MSQWTSARGLWPVLHRALSEGAGRIVKSKLQRPSNAGSHSATSRNVRRLCGSKEAGIKGWRSLVLFHDLRTFVCNAEDGVAVLGSGVFPNDPEHLFKAFNDESAFQLCASRRPPSTDRSWRPHASSERLDDLTLGENKRPSGVSWKSSSSVLVEAMMVFSVFIIRNGCNAIYGQMIRRGLSASRTPLCFARSCLQPSDRTENGITDTHPERFQRERNRNGDDGSCKNQAPGYLVQTGYNSGINPAHGVMEQVNGNRRRHGALQRLTTS